MTFLKEYQASGIVVSALHVFHSQNKLRRWVLLLFPIGRWEKWGNGEIKWLAKHELVPGRTTRHDPYGAELICGLCNSKRFLIIWFNVFGKLILTVMQRKHHWGNISKLVEYQLYFVSLNFPAVVWSSVCLFHLGPTPVTLAWVQTERLLPVLSVQMGSLDPSSVCNETSCKTKASLKIGIHFQGTLKLQVILFVTPSPHAFRILRQESPARSQSVISQC